MGLFRRKRGSDEQAERCPQCGEPLPEEAVECMMCGTDLRPLRRERGPDGVEPVEADSSAG